MRDGWHAAGMKERVIRVVAAVVLLVGVALAQGSLVWQQSPVNGHWYARLPATNHFNTSNAQAEALGARLATIRNAAENSWLAANVCQGQECWVDLNCDRTWRSGWPVDFGAGGDGACCPNQQCQGYSPTYYRLVLHPNGEWYRRSESTSRFAILELATNDPYTWAPLAVPSSPSVRHLQHMTHDSMRARTVFFGGRDDFAERSDTWEYSVATGWTPKFLSVIPAARRGGSFAFDPVRGVSVLFGGTVGTGTSQTWLGDTWTWNGTVWTQVATPVAPSAREGASMAFDFARQRLVLFGGVGAAGRPTDTWEFDGLAWTQVVTATTPTGRSYYTMFFDSLALRTVIFGGDTASGASDQTWTYDGVNWTQLNPSVRPPARGYAAFAWDSARSRGVLVGGFNGGNLDDVWQYAQGTWYKLHVPTRPGARRLAAMVFEGDRFHLFGGFTSLSITDPWTGRLVSGVRYYGAGCGNPAVNVTAAANTLPHLGTTFRLQVGNVPSSAIVTMMALGFSRTVYNSFFLPLPLDGLGMPGCNLYQDLSYRFGEFCTPVNATSWYYDLGIPAQPALMGLHIFCQPWVFDPTANAGSVLTGNAADVMIGRQ